MILTEHKIKNIQIQSFGKGFFSFSLSFANIYFSFVKLGRGFEKSTRTIQNFYFRSWSTKSASAIISAPSFWRSFRE